ncbi:hypothetical protein CAOG_08390 [Capsaspora owczarzaki ATCC 30864]|uniref:SREBP regulating gene protein n=1 Tax=Capsaspora owczarzaki (strain ATCC 30864) TaxID=595528 RepID=A0A0D2X061_CAPO3|nr:hypothetical protein CAOG_08390 [Capsaspora owczarzaki ATCC 30864]KJE88499.1 hypothetical protein CAOG_008390 [Capsaspora owczarzaki ATCC 30864]|eukprot:XP_011269960.1 hypothetical protein CAOG_08390 [Capsaspora owczarzaki ATCC 30864]
MRPGGSVRITLDAPRSSTAGFFRRLRRTLFRPRMLLVLLMVVMLFVMAEYHNARDASKIGHTGGRTLHTKGTAEGGDKEAVAAAAASWKDRSFSSNASSATGCRNTVQGRVLVTDDRGNMCTRTSVLPNGCCSPAANTTRQYVCDSCTPNDCCTQFEVCVSCCLQPSKTFFLIKFLHRARDALFMNVQDQFEMCLAKCRTSSLSVVHENTYKDTQYKYCFGHEPITTPPQHTRAAQPVKIPAGGNHPAPNPNQGSGQQHRQEQLTPAQRQHPQQLRHDPAFAPQLRQQQLQQQLQQQQQEQQQQQPQQQQHVQRPRQGSQEFDMPNPE